MQLLIFLEAKYRAVLPFIEQSLYCIYAFTCVFEVNMTFEPQF
jgi:hypothetical protein